MRLFKGIFMSCVVLHTAFFVFENKKKKIFGGLCMRIGKNVKKMIAFFLVFVMIAGALPVQVFADSMSEQENFGEVELFDEENEENEETGSEEIGEPEDFDFIFEYEDEDFKIEDEIFEEPNELRKYEIQEYFSETSDDFYTSSNVTIMAEGKCGDNLTWTLDSEGLLTIDGTGAMEDFLYLIDDWDYNSPWRYYRTDIKFIIISNGVTTIGNYAFEGIRNLMSIMIPNTVTTIGDGAFSRCTSLTNVIFENPSSVTTIKTEAFNHCNSLVSITIPNTVNTVESLAFANCINLKNVTISNKVTIIEMLTFSGCTSLTNVIFENPSIVKTIGFGAFSDCTSAL